MRPTRPEYNSGFCSVKHICRYCFSAIARDGSPSQGYPQQCATGYPSIHLVKIRKREEKVVV